MVAPVPHGDLLPMAAFVLGVHTLCTAYGVHLWTWLTDLAGAFGAVLLLVCVGRHRCWF
jgi:hypothetical protein